jgi:ABC-type transporter Mla MlaB component
VIVFFIPFVLSRVGRPPVPTDGPAETHRRRSPADEFPAIRRSKWRVVSFAIRGPIRRDDLPGLCTRVCALLERNGGGTALCDVRGVAPDAVTVDALARLQLAARGRGCRVLLRGASDELRELVAFMGLADVLPG